MANANQADGDGDGLGDACDACPADGLRPDGTTTCWSPSNDAGAHRLNQPPAGVRFRTLVTGFVQACGISTAGELRCWGAKLK